ncbi:radical SAM family heme chaperone HemW [Capnocytophaga sp. oral taxon 878]|uniref:radical SAM family heme chaperone HemW n=1 Tax=Capnocytophaga sp. oral taxon 878 TaxID=1316596 RepID=UPI000D031BF8|nr:radical SAM family heme chaperone HemW [Capnocytophaga sp. oral taxon 878]AVM49610.1 coproporphyrinogen III oxidase [Capnocytophaga sp. oral taxon 878]
MYSLYIHIPFCRRACYYCDFHFSTTLKHKAKMVTAICKELELRKEEAEGTELQTIYLGGGTPSILSNEELAAIFNTIYLHYKISSFAEITLEANPDDFFRDTTPKERLLALQQLGINRLSLGVQSFFAEDLQLMNRIHTTEQIETLLPIALQYFDNITIDLIYGIPTMSNERWQKNIDKALDFGIPHISAYALTVEEKTALHKFIATGKIPPINDNLAYDHFITLIDKLETKKFVQYEFSNFGKEGYFSKNNTAYWFGKPYMGIGPSAHSFNGKERSWNIANNIKYLQQILQEGKLPQEKEILSINNRYNELIITRIRTMIGINIDEVALNFGKEYKNYLLQQAQKYLEEEMLLIESNHLKVSKKGKFLSDGIAADLFRVD